MKTIATLLAFFYALSANAQNEIKSIKAFNNSFTMSVPSDIDTMTAAQMQEKYRKKPDGKTIFYADKNVNFSIVITPVTDGIKEAEMVEHKEELTSQFSAKGYKLEENIVKKVNGHNLIIVSFYSDVPDGKIFNKRFFAVVKDKLILVTFNSSSQDLEKRKKQIEESINSVMIE